MRFMLKQHQKHGGMLIIIVKLNMVHNANVAAALSSSAAWIGYYDAYNEGIFHGLDIIKQIIQLGMMVNPMILLEQRIVLI